MHIYSEYKILEIGRTSRDALINKLRYEQGYDNPDYGDDVIISLEELNALYMKFISETLPSGFSREKNIYSFIRLYGICALDNEIHLLRYREHLNLFHKSSDELEMQIELIESLLKKYRLMQSRLGESITFKEEKNSIK